MRDAATFATYFEREVLVRLASADLHLLTRAAVCTRFSASLCASLMARPDAVREIGERLAQLDGDDLFITQVSGAEEGETWYRLHPLLREVLLARLAKLPEVERGSLHAAAWRWFDAQGDIDEAVGHAVLAGDPQAAAEMVQACAHGLLAKGELSRLAGLMRRLPPSEIAARFGLHLMSAFLQMYAGDVDALTQSIRHMESHGEPLGARQRYALTLLRGGLALQRDDTDSVSRCCRNCSVFRPTPAISSAPGVATSSRGCSSIAANTNRRAWCWRRARLHGGAPRGVLLGRCMSGMSHVAEGRVLVAERVLLRRAGRGGKHGRAYVGIACMAAALLGEALYELNDVGRHAGCSTSGSTYWSTSRYPIRCCARSSCSRTRTGSPDAGSRHGTWLERLEDYANGIASTDCSRARYACARAGCWRKGRWMTRNAALLRLRSAGGALLRRDA